MFQRFSPQRLLECLSWTTGSALKSCPCSHFNEDESGTLFYTCGSRKILNSKTSNDLSIEFVFRPRLGNLVTIPLCKRSSTAFHWTVYERSFAVMGPKLWNCIPYNLNSIQNMDLFKMRFTGFLMSVPDTPPVRGYTPTNSNSLLCWRKDRGASTSWSGQPRRLYWRSTKHNIGNIGR